MNRTRRGLRKAEPRAGQKSTWSDYMGENNNYCASHFDAKHQFVAYAIRQFAPKRVLDVGCNTGYFPVRASLSGIRTAAGIDLGDYTEAVQVLNEITGASARFSVGSHDSSSHTIGIKENFGIEKFDVVSTSAVLCHLPDPLHFLASLGQLASKGVFIWNTFMETEELLVHYNPPNRFTDREFPNGFDEGTSISIGLLLLSMAKLGFPHHEEIEFRPDWMPDYWTRPACLHAYLFWR